MEFNTSTTVKRPRPKTLPGLGHFTGTENYYRHPIGQLMYTDGVKHVAEHAHAYWLLDVVFSHTVSIYSNKAIPEDQKRLLACKLLVDDVANTAVFTVEDGNDNQLAEQEIPYTDFPAIEQRIWVQNGVAMLPSEY